ncbi:MAG TPA: YggS family pyridoxal phosphate-dependent enzyme [Acidobacteriota bacterium]|nr:YggS family pyridoxal phosphate-dependent enzyme [Acidobacteriota bacterium]
MNHIAHNLSAIRERIARASQASGRAPEEVLLLAISKTFPVELIEQAVESGQCRFGESRVQEAEGKIPPLRAIPNLEWHLVGHLQSNKARRAAELFDVIHSLDNVKLAARLDQACREMGKKISVLLQVDLGGEETKFGTPPEKTAEIIKALAAFPSLHLDGLMTIPPFLDDPEQVRPYFRMLRAIKDDMEARNPGCLGKRHLSMGMSHDFEVAISEGATIVRIGTAIFGSRQ